MATLDRIRAPYNFVPASQEVVLLPDDLKRVSQDVPFSDGICGGLQLTITAETPIFVRGARIGDEGQTEGGGDRDGPKPPDHFFTVPDGRRAIPGSSLKGMIRNVLEIASFGKLGRVNDHTFGVRDLQNPDLYRNHFADIIDRKPSPLVGAGWLGLKEGASYDDDGSPMWEIQTCHFAKVHYADAAALAEQYGIQDYKPGKKQSAVEKYELWDKANAKRGAFARVDVIAKHGATGISGARRIGEFSRVKRGTLRPSHGSSAQPSEVGGRLVFTGQPSAWDGKQEGKNSPKHHDFLFYGLAGKTLDVSFRIRRAFSQVHSSGGEQHRLDDSPNREWAYWLDAMRRGKKVPVFFLTDRQGNLRAFGLAMMFKLAYDHSTREAVQNAQPEAFSPEPDLAELIFGRVPPRRGEGVMLRGRASFETAVEVGRANELPMVKGVLGAPKASFYPNYIEQSDKPGRHGAQPERDSRDRPMYQTYMSPRPRARGWKRYPQREHEAALPAVPLDANDKPNEKVASAFHPLATGATFATRLVVHNLRPFELGALLWCLDFGGRRDCRHGIGMAKAYGYGGARIEIVGNDLRDVQGRPVDLAAARQAFVQFMETRIQSWSVSAQIADLLALATPVPAGSDEHLRNMQIEHPRFGNEFNAVKKQGLALPPAGSSQR